MTTTRVRQLVIVLAGLWAGLVGVRLMIAEPPQEVPLRWTSRADGVAAKPSPGAEGWQVKSLDPPVRSTASNPTRNIFMAGGSAVVGEERGRRVLVKASPPPPVPAPVAVVASPSSAPSEPTPEEQAEQEASRQRELARMQLKDLMGQYRYLGYLAQNGAPQVFIGKGHEIHILRPGDRIEGKFVVSSVNATTVTLRAVESDLETILQLKKEGEEKQS